MLFINYKGSTPQQRFYSFAVQGNNNANVVRFMVEKMQDDIDLAIYTPYLKVQSKEHEYIDKILLTKVVGEDYITIDWEITRKSTQYRNLELQLQFENSEDDIVFQCLIVEMELNGTIKADKEISEAYPSELQRIEGELEVHEERLDALDNDVEHKVDKTIEANKVYGTDELGNQTTYPKDSFGQVEDVKVNGVSVVEDKVANIDLTPYAKLLGELPKINVNSIDRDVLTFFVDNIRYLRKPIIIDIENAIYLIGIFSRNQDTPLKFSFSFLQLPNCVISGNNVDMINISFSDLISEYGKDFETTDNRTSVITDQSTNKQYPTAKAVYDLVQAIKRNAFTPVDTTTYPTLADFLESTGEEGYLYLYPVDTSDLTKGYKQYIWENSAWVYMGDTQLDLTNYPRKDQNETITGNWTFNQGIFGNDNIKIGNDVMVAGVGRGLTYAGGYIYLVNGYVGINIGNGIANPIVVDGYITTIRGRTKLTLKQQNGNYGLVVPDTTSWTADKEIATTDQVVVKANESIISDQYDSTKTYAVGDLVIYNNTLYKCITAITTAEDFDATHWTATTVAELVADETIDINDIKSTMSFKKIAYADYQALSSNEKQALLDVGCQIIGTLNVNVGGGDVINPVLYPRRNFGTYSQGIFIAGSSNQSATIGTWEQLHSGNNLTIKVLMRGSDEKLTIQRLSNLNGASFPSYPSDASTKTYIPKLVNGSWVFVEDV